MADLCPKCASPIDPATASYDDRGNLLCRACFSRQSAGNADALLTAKDPTTNRNLWGGAIATSFLGLMTCVTSALGTFFFVAAPLALLSGGATLRALFGDPATKQRLGVGYWLVILLCVSGMGLGTLSILIGVLYMALAADH
jgi:hypothetical protein